jgi:hypothetical protein
VDIYLKIAADNKMRITKVAETHIHADFLSDVRELAKLIGAELYLSGEGGKDWSYEFSHVGLKDGDVFKLGNLKFEVMHPRAIRRRASAFCSPIRPPAQSQSSMGLSDLDWQLGRAAGHGPIFFWGVLQVNHKAL